MPGAGVCRDRGCRRCVPRARSLSNGQVVMRDCRFSGVHTVVREMFYGSCMDLVERLLVCGTVVCGGGLLGRGSARQGRRRSGPGPACGRAAAPGARDGIGAMHLLRHHGHLRLDGLLHRTDQASGHRAFGCRAGTAALQAKRFAVRNEPHAVCGTGRIRAYDRGGGGGHGGGRRGLADPL